MTFPFRSNPLAKLSLATLVLVVASSFDARAQSSDPFRPTPVFSNEIGGRILPRDVGDARRTRHFYTFIGREGDITVNVESTNLNGDVDLYTAGSLRPLMKITLYGGTATRATKSVFLRRDEQLVLRVEARAVGDAEGTYRISFGGTFATAPAELAGTTESPVLPEPVLEERRGTRPVTATGARIEVPVAEVTTKEETKTDAVKTDETVKAEREEASAESAKPARTDTTRSARRGRGSTRARPGGRADRSAPPKSAETKERAGSGKSREETPAKKKADDSAEKSDDSTKKTDGSAERAASTSSGEAEKTPSPRSAARNTRREPRRVRKESRTESAGDAARAREPVASEARPATSQRLIIVTKDGQTIEHDMNTVRRVTVENNQVVVNTRDGKTFRRPLADVLKMSIEP